MLIALLRSFRAILPFCHPANSALRRSSGHPERGRRMQYYVIDPVSSDPPKHRPLERFWPYAELPEQPTDEELAALDPDLHEALFGARPRPFSITLVFPALDTPAFGTALELANVGAGCLQKTSGVLAGGSRGLPVEGRLGHHRRIIEMAELQNGRIAEC